MAKMGRPPVEVDMHQLATIMRFKPRLEDAAAFFKVSPDTIENRIKDATGLTFSEFRDQNFVQSRFALIQEALMRAKKSDTMLIFCLKALCGWSDKLPGEVETAIQINNNTQNVQLTGEDMARLVKAARGEG